MLGSGTFTMEPFPAHAGVAANKKIGDTTAVVIFSMDIDLSLVACDVSVSPLFRGLAADHFLRQREAAITPITPNATSPNMLGSGTFVAMGTCPAHAGVVANKKMGVTIAVVILSIDIEFPSIEFDG